MTERMKRFLEEKFRQVTPTKGAMEFRKQTLKRMENYAQDLRVKGMEDEDLIFDMCVQELGDFDQVLKDFEANPLQEEMGNHRKVNYIILGVAAGIFAMVVAYLLLGVLAHLWHPGWLLLVGSALLGVAAGFILLAVKCGKEAVKTKSNVKWILMRLCVVVVIVMFAVIIFLCWQILAPAPRFAWYTFLVMVNVMFLADTVIAFITKSKIAFWESLATLIVTVVMVYVMVGVAVPHFWHPGWMMFPIAVFIDLVLIFGKIWAKNSQKAKKLKTSMADRMNGVDEKYYTEW